MNGTKALILRETDGTFNTIVGQTESTFTFNGTPIDVSSKSNDDNVSLMDGELATKGASISMSFVHNSNTEYEAMRAAQVSKTIQSFKLSFNTNDEVDLYFSGIVNGLSDALPTGDKTAASLTITTTSEVYRANPFLESGGDDFVTSDGDTLYVRAA